MDGLTFIADFAYERQNESELSFAAGDIIKITASQDGWLYGQHTTTKLEGWVSQAFGHTRNESPYNKMSKDVKDEKRKLLYKNIIAAETEFTNLLADFVKEVITPMNLRDTPFKRQFLSDSAVAVSFNLLQDLYKACHNFESILKISNTDIEVSNAYIQFSASLQIFAQYASENAKLLNTIKTNIRQLSEIVPERINMGQILVLPMEHVVVYKSLFQEYIWLTPANSPDFAALEAALTMITTQTQEVEAKIKEEEESWKLLNLQNQCKYAFFFLLVTSFVLSYGSLEYLSY
jgi:hypothetical protein